MWPRLPALVQGALLLLSPLVLLGVPRIVEVSAAWSPSALAADNPPDIRTFVTLHVNTLDQGETVAVIHGDDVLIPIAALEGAGIHGLKGKRQEIRAQEYVSLASLSPDLRYKLDLDTLALDVTVTPAHLGSTSMNLSNARPANIQYTSGSSGYLNYAFSTASGGASSAFFDGSVAHDQDSFHAAVTAQRDLPIQRGLVYYQMDDRDTEIRRVIGDLDAASGDLGGSMFVAGFGAARDFNLDPYAIHFPLPTLSGVVTSPSIANVYVNGVLVQRVNLPPGSFNLNQLPVTNGAANAQVVVTDAFGQSTTYSQNYYTAAALLTPGQNQFSYAGGLLRQNAFTVGDSYGPGAVVGSYRAGVNDGLTAGGRFEATPRLVSAGPTADFHLVGGLVHVSAAASDDQGYSGAAADVAYSYSSPMLGFGFAALAQGPYYANISQPLDMDRPTSSLSAFVSTQLGRTSSLSLEVIRRKMRDSGTASQILLTDTISLQHGLSLNISAEHSTSTIAAPQVGITSSLGFSMGRTYATVTSQTGTTKSNGVEVSEAPPGKYGFGYAANYNPSYDHSLNGSLTYDSQYGDGEVDYATADGAPITGSVRVAGGVAFVDRGVYATAPVTGSFALVDVPNTPGVEVYLENQSVGKTNSSGKLLVPDLIANYGNAIRIDDKDVPLNTSIQTVQQLIAPPDQAGAVVTFASAHLQALTGKILVDERGKQIVPQYGELHVDGGGFHAQSVLGGNGEFYLENIPVGKYKARVIFAGGECVFDFASPSSSDMMVKLGTLGCTMP